MFLADSLQEKLKRNLFENEGQILSQAKYPYHPKEKSLKILFPSEINSVPNLNILSKEEWQSTFNLKQLHKKWNVKTDLDYELKHTKFSDEIIAKEAVIAKEYVKDLIDPDVFGNKQKRWNKSTSLSKEPRDEVKQTLFEIKHGLKNFKIVKCKEQSCSKGVNTRSIRDFNGKHWNLSTQLEKEEKLKLSHQIKQTAIENSKLYWKINEDNRYNCSPFLVSEERRKFEVIRHFKKYRTPFQQTMDIYSTMNKVKQLTSNERTKVEKEVRYNNPGSSKKREKIDGIVHREMFNLYRDKYNELIGNLDKKELRRRQFERNKFKWNDKDLVNKMLMLDSIDKDKLGWFIQGYKTRSQSQPNIKRELLKPLVPQGNDIFLEQEKLKEITQEEYKKQQKKELLLKQKFFSKSKSIRNDKSKYSISEEEYQKTLKEITTKTINHDDRKNKTKASFTITNELDKYFFDSYKNITESIIQKRKSYYQKKENDYEETYSHPGIFVS